MQNPYSEQINALEAEIAANQKLLSDPELSELAISEIERLQKEKQVLEKAADAFLSGQSDEPNPGELPKNCILELRGGAGGEEAKIWAHDLLRMYLRFCETLGLKIELVDELVVKIKGKTSEIELAELETPLTPYSIFRYESGVHRVQRIPSTESQGRIHTSTASVAVLPEVNQKAVVINDEDLDWQFTRSGGAGGQHVNKTSSAVRLTHKPSGIVVTARNERSQIQNRATALELLRSQLWEIEEEKRLAELGDARSSIGRNRRSEKIKTYNYPQNRVTDHRINKSWHNLENILEGNLRQVVEETQAAFVSEGNEES